MLKITTPIVSVDWLNENLNHTSLVLLDATMTKVSGCDTIADVAGISIKNAQFFDIKNVFSDIDAPFPNTILPSEVFQEKVQELGINTDSCIVVYDIYGYYSCVRVWWMFKAMGFENIAILDGGLPDWLDADYPTQKKFFSSKTRGNFKANYISGMIHNHERVLNSMHDETFIVLDARSENRFKGIDPEPREGLRSGHIPRSKCLPYLSLLNGTKMKSVEELTEIFLKFNDKKIIFSCGSGITACILALAGEIVGLENMSVYDGSWTEWGSLKELPIETN